MSWGVIASMYIGNFVLLILPSPFIPALKKKREEIAREETS